MQCAERLPLAATCDGHTPRVILSVESWSAIARIDGRLRDAGRVMEVRVAHLGACGIDRYELRARVADAQGMIDDRIWLCTRQELQAFVGALGDGADARALSSLLNPSARPA